MNKTISVKETVKVATPVVESVKKSIMKVDGKRVHTMNINMKKKLLQDMPWDVSKDFNKETKSVLKLSDNKHYTRFLEELKIAKCLKNNVAENNNELVKIRANMKYWVADFNTVKYLVKSKGGMIEGFLKIVQ